MCCAQSAAFPEPVEKPASAKTDPRPTLVSVAALTEGSLACIIIDALASVNGWDKRPLFVPMPSKYPLGRVRNPAIVERMQGVEERPGWSNSSTPSRTIVVGISEVYSRPACRTSLLGLPRPSTPIALDGK